MSRKQNKRLTKAQKEHLLALISEGLETDEINRRAKKFKPAFQVSRQQVDYYRRETKTELKEIQSESKSSALREGFAVREKRVEALNELAEKHFEELTTGGMLWLNQVKSIGFGDNAKIIDYEEYNEAEVKQFRGLLDDIAKEMGERKQKIEHSGRIDVSKLSDEELDAIINAEDQS